MAPPGSHPARPGLRPFSGDAATRAAALSLATNAFLLVLKVAVGIISGSIAVLSDGLDSAEDLVASGAAWISVRVGARPADYEHPYGHGKVESLSAALEAGIISVGGAFIAYNAAGRLLKGAGEIDLNLGLGAMAGAVAINLLASLYVGRAARTTRSTALAADAQHLRVNMVQALGVLGGLGLVWVTGLTLFDALVALLLVGYMAWTAYRVLRSALVEIMDVRLSPVEEAAVRESLRRYQEGVRGYHSLRSRRSGRQRHIDLHLVVAPERTVAQVHRLCDDIEAQISERLPGSTVVIHVEPDDGRHVEPLE